MKRFEIMLAIIVEADDAESAKAIVDVLVTGEPMETT